MPIILNGRVVGAADGSAEVEEVSVVERRSQLSRTVEVVAERTHADGGAMRMRGQRFSLPLRSLKLKVSQGLVREFVADGVSTSGALAGRFDRATLEAMDPEELEEMAEIEGLEVKGTGKGGRVLKRDLVKALAGV